MVNIFYGFCKILGKVYLGRKNGNPINDVILGGLGIN